MLHIVVLPPFVCVSVRSVWRQQFPSLDTHTFLVRNSLKQTSVLHTVFSLLNFGSEIQFKFWNAVYCFILEVDHFGILAV